MDTSQITINRRISKEEVFKAIDEAHRCTGPVEEGNVGSGTPMSGYGFKGGIGTSSRKIGDRHHRSTSPVKLRKKRRPQGTRSTD